MILPLVSLSAVHLAEIRLRFQSFNGREANTLLDCVWKPMASRICSKRTTMGFTLAVNRCKWRFNEILFPSAPGELNFDSETMKG